MARRVHGYVSGTRVQGVAFRSNARERARKAGVNGWIRNLSDGRVEFVFEGETEAVDALLEWCETGPPRASVGAVEVEDESPTGSEMSFSVRSNR